MKRAATGHFARGTGVYAVGGEVYVTEIEAKNKGYQIHGDTKDVFGANAHATSEKRDRKSNV